MENKFETELYTLEKLADHRFIIPPYQRPYVWGDEQINKLLYDFYEAFTRDDKYYYVGTVLLSELEDGDKKIYQLIDGQQRFTTLWLIAVSFKILSEDTEIQKFLHAGDELRIDFAIRKQIKSYMLDLLKRKGGEESQYSDKEIEDDEYLTNIAKAVTIVTGKINSFKDRQEFGNYIFKYVQFVVNTVPEGTDLKKLFAIINNSGVQLEQSDILKSQLLKIIKTEKVLYSRIWEACENMNDFFERNVRQLFPVEFDWSNIQYDALKEFTLSSEDKSNTETDNNCAFSIADILEVQNVNNKRIDLKFLDDNPKTIMYNVKLSEIRDVSAKLFGDWIGNEIEAEYCLMLRGNDKINIQYKIFDDRYCKGVEIELSQNENNIDARIVWAKSTNRRGNKNEALLQKNWNIEDDKLGGDIPIGSEGYGISEIVINPVISKKDKQNETDENIDRCRSIIKFPQLLTHAYRIFLYNNNEQDFEKPFHSDKLLQIFETLTKKDEQSIKEFFKCLWKVRWDFDKYVVKWISTDEREVELLLTSISKQDNYFIRTNNEKSDISMLQNMMYFTGNYNTQIWLTPYLKRLLDGEDTLPCLETIDNKLSLSKRSDKETSFDLMDKDFDFEDRFDFEDYLTESNGTSFRHYWFQKLEYILWKEFKDDDKWKTDEKFKNYRITSKNSVEHVFPRKPEYEHKTISETALDDFGNLALLNVSQNSSYSNQDVGKKQIDFYNKFAYDALKLVFLYSDANLKNYNKQEIEEKIENHRIKMIDKIKVHYQ